MVIRVLSYYHRSLILPMVRSGNRYIVNSMSLIVFVAFIVWDRNLRCIDDVWISFLLAVSDETDASQKYLIFWRTGGDLQDTLILRGWRLSSRTWNTVTSPWMKQSTWLRITHSGDQCLHLALRTPSGAFMKYWWVYADCVGSGCSQVDGAQISFMCLLVYWHKLKD